MCVGFVLGLVNLEVQEAITTRVHNIEKAVEHRRRYCRTVPARQAVVANYAVELQLLVSFVISAALFVVGKVHAYISSSIRAPLMLVVVIIRLSHIDTMTVQCCVSQFTCFFLFLFHPPSTPPSKCLPALSSLFATESLFALVLLIFLPRK